MDSDLRAALNPEMTNRKHNFERFLDRSNAFHQSRGALNINRIGGAGHHYFSDIIHTLLHKSTRFLVIALFLTYTASYCLFAPLYLLISEPCGLRLHTFTEAFILSLMAQTTIGFGIPNDYMHGCPQGGILLTMQSVIASMLDAIIIGGFWLRVSRPQNRSQSVLFSNKAVIQEIRGSFYLMFQICELRKHQLVEAKVRCYSMRHSPTFSSRTMRLQRPDDELGGMLLLAVPSVVVHRIDAWSPLMPPPTLPPLPAPSPSPHQHNHHTLSPAHSMVSNSITSVDDESEDQDDDYHDRNTEMNERINTKMSKIHSRNNKMYGHDAAVDYLFPDIPQRESDIENGNREAKSKHSRAYQSYRMGGNNNLSSGNVDGQPRHLNDNVKLKEDIKAWLHNSGSEVLALVEGEENMTGCSLQARHSYTIDDVEFDMTFAPCVSSDLNGGCTIDYSLFHNLIPVGNRGDDFGRNHQRGTEFSDSTAQSMLMRCSSISDFYSEA